jgi:hypothetical protein
MVRFDCTLFNTFLYICNFCGIKLCCDHIFTSRSSFHQNQKDNLCSDYTVYFHFHFFHFSFFFFFQLIFKAHHEYFFISDFFSTSQTGCQCMVHNIKKLKIPLFIDFI